MFPYSEALLQATVDYKREQITRAWGRPTHFRLRRSGRAQRPNPRLSHQSHAITT